jgi:hypothetical protein
MKSKIEKQAYKLMFEAEVMYDTATKRKQYEKAHCILEIINEEFENINI